MSVVKHQTFNLEANFQIFQIWDLSVTSLGSRAQCGGGVGSAENRAGDWVELGNILLNHSFLNAKMKIEQS